MHIEQFIRRNFQKNVGTYIVKCVHWVYVMILGVNVVAFDETLRERTKLKFDFRG